MRSIFRTAVLRRDYDSILSAIAGFWIIQILARHSGIGISPDSVIYISTASNILQHGAINDFSGWPMMDFPAGYPLFLSAIQGITRTSIQSIGAIIDGLIFGAFIFTSGWLMERFSGRNRGYKWALLTFVVLSPCLLEIYSMIWSETLFLFLTLLFIVVIRPYCLEPGLRKLAPAIIVTALACVTRYAGISLIVIGGVLIICIRELAWVKKLVHLVVFGIGASSLLALNIYRNHRVTGTLTGYREKAVTSLGANLFHFGSVCCDWLPFFNERYALATGIAVLFILLAAVIVFFRWFAKKDTFSYENLGTIYFLVYALFILIVASVSRFQELDSRLLSPLFVPWLWSFTSWAPAWFGRLKTGRPFLRWAGIAALLVCAGCFQWGQIQAFKENWEGIAYAGIPGYTEDQWRYSPTMDFVRHNADMHRPYSPLYSNAYEGIWFLTGVKSDLLPHKEFAQDINEMLAEDHFYVIWFNDSINGDLITIDYIKQRRKLEKVYNFDDGAVYLFTR